MYKFKSDSSPQNKNYISFICTARGLAEPELTNQAKVEDIYLFI